MFETIKQFIYYDFRIFGAQLFFANQSLTKISEKTSGKASRPAWTAASAPMLAGKTMTLGRARCLLGAMWGPPVISWFIIPLYI